MLADAIVFTGGGDRWWSNAAAADDDGDEPDGGGLGVRIDADLGIRKLGLFLVNDVKKPLESESIFLQSDSHNGEEITFILDVAGGLGRLREVGGVGPLEGLHDLAKGAAPSLLAGRGVLVGRPLAD